MHLAAHSLRCRLAGVALITGLFFALAASFSAKPAAAATGPGCTFQTRTARVISLRIFQHRANASRAAFFRKHRHARTRRAFVASQKARLAALRHSVARCSTSSGLADSNPTEQPPPCSPSLPAAPYSGMTEGTTRSGPALTPNSHIQAVMLFVDFPDLHATESTSSLYNRLVPGSSRWFNEVSYGRSNLEVTAAHRWFRMPHSFRDYGLADGISWVEQRNYIADAVAAADDSVDFSPFRVVYVVAAKGSPVERSPAFHAYPGDGVHADGTELTQGATFFEDIRSDATYASHVLVHETGHILGLPDLYDVPNPVFWSLFRYAGGWDMMSWNDPGGHFLAWEKWKLGWLDQSQLTCLTSPGEVTATITPLERAGGLKAVVVPTGPSSAYIIEARKKIGQDAKLCDEGVLIYSVDASVRSGYGPVHVRAAQRDTNGELLNQCGPLYNAPFDNTRGEVSHFEDNAVGLTVRILASGANGYRVKVTRTSMVPQQLVDTSAQSPVGEELAPPQAPFLLAVSPFGMLWNLSLEESA